MYKKSYVARNEFERLCVIRNEHGEAIQVSKNLRGIREYVSNHIIKVLEISEIYNGQGGLCVLFENGASFQTSFVSFSVLKGVIKRWYNIQGAPLLVNGIQCGVVSINNHSLQ